MEKKITATKYHFLELTVQYVFRANFNDTYYLETVYIPLTDFEGGESVWIDPYQGRSRQNHTLLSVQSCSDTQCVLLEKTDDTVKSRHMSTDALHICCEDFDESRLLAAHVCIRKEKNA